MNPLRDWRPIELGGLAPIVAVRAGHYWMVAGPGD